MKRSNAPALAGLLALGIAGLFYCSEPTAPRGPTEFDYWATHVAQLKSLLKDPYSAKIEGYTSSTPRGGVASCGTVNSKNSFGAYTGPVRWLSRAGETLVDNGGETFTSSWNSFCLGETRITKGQPDTSYRYPVASPAWRPAPQATEGAAPVGGRTEAARPSQIVRDYWSETRKTWAEILTCTEAPQFSSEGWTTRGPCPELPKKIILSSGLDERLSTFGCDASRLDMLTVSGLLVSDPSSKSIAQFKAAVSACDAVFDEKQR